MTVKVFAIFDAKGNGYSMPYLWATQGVALREFIRASKDVKSNINQFPLDYSLWLLGEYDDQTGRFENEKVPRNLGTAYELGDFANQIEVPRVTADQVIESFVKTNNKEE